MIKTFRVKLILVLLGFVFFTILSSWLIFNYIIKTTNTLSDITQKAESVQTLLLKDVAQIRLFFENETINPNFFKTGKSKIIDNHRLLCKDIEIALSELKKNQKENDFDLEGKIASIQLEFINYKNLTDNIIRQILVRGFEDFGVEGKMRTYAHKLESYDREIGLINILQLRRHEKDYILRQDNSYLNKHEELTKTIKNALIKNLTIAAARKSEIIFTLDRYAGQFRMLTLFERHIGLKNTNGIKTQIDNVVDRIEKNYMQMQNAALLKEQKQLTSAKIIYAILFLVFVLGSFLAARFISTRISTSITELKEKVTDFINSDYTKKTTFYNTESNSEIMTLARNFSLMEQHIINQNEVLKQTNNELEALFYKASYSIKAPLNEVVNIMADANEKIQAPESLKYFSMMEYYCQRISDVVDEIRAVNNVKNEEIVIERINFDTLIKSVLSEYRSLEISHNVVFSVDISQKKEFYSSSIFIKTIIKHLVENAIKHSKKKDIRCFIKIAVSSQKSDMLKLVISDNGIGIKKELQDKVFNLFFNASNTLGDKRLGFYIVQNALQKINGAISIDSRENKGTTFTIILPSKVHTRNKFDRLHQKKIAYQDVDNIVLDYM